jgi:hypothetical protein
LPSRLIISGQLVWLFEVKDELLAQKDAPFADIHYDTIFDDKVLGFLGTKDFKTAITDYVKKYNELLAASTYFSQSTFNYYNAATIAKSLADNGFFDAKHTVSLNANEKLEITNKAGRPLKPNTQPSVSIITEMHNGPIAETSGARS